MPLEIELKFLVDADRFDPRGLESQTIVQGFLSRSKDTVVRVRLKGDSGFLTVKARIPGRDAARQEFEYPIPAEDARQMLKLCPAGISKTRYLMPRGPHVWEIDVFHGAHQGLIVAEIELGDEGESYERPDFIGKDVTGDPGYLNSNLAGEGFLAGTGLDD